MEVSMVRQALVLLYSIVIGCALGVVYDVIRVHRVMLGVVYAHRTVRMLKKIPLPLLDGRRRPPSRLFLKLAAWLRLGRDVVICVQDICFFVFAGLVTTVFIYHANYGQIRWFALFGLGLGFFVYYNTIGRLVMLCSEFIAFFIRAMFAYLWFFVYTPVTFATGMLRRGCVRLFALLRRGVRWVFCRLALWRRSRRLSGQTLAGAREGFLGSQLLNELF